MKPILFSTEMVKAILDGRKTMTRRVFKSRTARYCIGDELWVRETWCERNAYMYEDNTSGYLYKADNFDEMDVKWRPSIFMPKEASRIFLKITDVRVEHLQDITNADAKSEGAEFWNLASDCKKESEFVTEYFGEYCHEEKRDYRKGFQILWDSINKKRGYSWDTNPIVLVYSFERMQNEKKQ